MSTILLTGATGVLGKQLRPRLLDRGHEIRAASRTPPAENTIDWVELDLIEGTGIAESMRDIDIVVHAASDAAGDSEAVDLHGTERLLTAAEDADIENFLYISIVGIDDIPYSYYQHKREAERQVESSPVPSTIVRSTQFHSFVAFVLYKVSWLPVWPLPTEFRLQPIDPGDAAEAIVNYATEEAIGRTPDIGGPKVMTIRDLATAYREHRGLHRPIIRFPIPGRIAAAFRAGNAICPDQQVGSISWQEWLESQKGIPGKGEY